MSRRYQPQVRRRPIALPVFVLAGIAAITALITLAEPPTWLSWLPPWLAAVIAAVSGVIGRGAVSPLRRHLGRQKILPRIGDPPAQALALGVHPAIPLAESGASASPIAPQRSDRLLRLWQHIRGTYGTGNRLDPDLPTFVPRDAGEEIRKWMSDARKTGGFLLLIGNSSVGKTRLLYETASKVLPDFAVLAPDPGAGGTVNTLGEATLPLPKPGLIVWLDELQRFLDGPYLAPGSTPITATTMRQLLDAPTPVVVLGTLWPQYAIKLRATERDPCAGPAQPRYPCAADILNVGRRKEVTLHSFSESERNSTVSKAQTSGTSARKWI